MSNPTHERRPLNLGVILALAALACGLAHGQDAGRPTDAAVTDDGWDLSRCLGVALGNSPYVAISEESVIAARTAVDKARSGYYPQLTVDGDVGVGDRDATQGGAAVQAVALSAGAGLGIDWSLFETGRNDVVDEVKSELLAAQLRRAAELQDVVEQVSGAYYAVLAAYEMVAVAEDGIAAAEQHLYDVQRRIDIGSVAEVDVYVVQEDLARAQLDEIDARSGVRTAVAQLRNAIGLSHRFDLRIRAPEDEGPDEVPAIESAIELALQNRPEISAAAASLRARGYTLERADKARDPNLALGSSLAYNTATVIGGDADWRISGRMSWPIFDGGSTEADEDRARSAVRRAEGDLQANRLRAALEAEEAVIELERTEERIAAAQASVDAAQARLAAARTKYTQDVGILLEVTDARAAYTAAAANLVRARFDYRLALVTIERATGTLAIPAPEPFAMEDGLD